MAGMIIQHNLNAINANNKLNVNVLGSKKSSEKLSSGFRINRAADDAAGLAISEKMRAQVRGLNQAIRNANDGISLIQTGEGALEETHDMLKRLKELAVQAGNETYSDEERKYMQMEVDTIKEEIDRIAKATDFNGIKLLDGSLGGIAGNTGTYGARYGTLVSTAGHALAGATLVSNIENVAVSFTVDASGKGGENAEWDATGTILTINLAQGVAYTQSQIDELVKNANYAKNSLGQTAAPATVKITLGMGVYVANDPTDIAATKAGVRATHAAFDLTPFLIGGNSTEFYADHIQFTSNSYGPDERKFTISTVGCDAGKEFVQQTNTDGLHTKLGQFVLHLATGVEYSEQDIQNILAKAGLDYTVTLTDTRNPDGDVKFYANTAATGNQFQLGGGLGVGKDVVGGGGKGLTLQIGGNNAVEQRVTVAINAMDASALGVANFNLSTVQNAQIAMDSVNAAIIKVSEQRASLGAMQNRLEHTINSLTTTTENIEAAEAQIRDTDMATEMVTYTKYNILQQSAQAMLAQANQAPQAILQLLR